MKILLWVILIIFLIGLLVVTGVFKMIFLYCCLSASPDKALAFNPVWRISCVQRVIA